MTCCRLWKTNVACNVDRHSMQTWLPRCLNETHAWSEFYAPFYGCLCLALNSYVFITICSTETFREQTAKTTENLRVNNYAFVGCRQLDLFVRLLWQVWKQILLVILTFKAFLISKTKLSLTLWCWYLQKDPELQLVKVNVFTMTLSQPPENTILCVMLRLDWTIVPKKFKFNSCLNWAFISEFYATICWLSMPRIK